MLQNTPADLNLHVTLLGTELRPVVSAKDLGVYMDATLSFDENLPLSSSFTVEFLTRKAHWSNKPCVIQKGSYASFTKRILEALL